MIICNNCNSWTWDVSLLDLDMDDLVKNTNSSMISRTNSVSLGMDGIIICNRNTFEKLQNTIFFKIFKIPSNGQLV